MNERERGRKRQQSDVKNIMESKQSRREQGNFFLKRKQKKKGANTHDGC